jgi:cytochrome oxidase Cu insertion factor (SCO1/SenC/PrrC family)
MKAILAILFAMLILGVATVGSNFSVASAQGRQKPRQAPKPKDPSASLRIPDATVYDQNGNRLRFYTDLVKGKTVAINFIFTTCTAICPALTSTFRRVQTELGDRAGQDVHLISVSVDPTVDVPERLKEYAAKFKAGPGWTFVTGDKAQIDSVLQALGTAVADKNDHTPMVLIGNESVGDWSREYGLSPPMRLVELLKASASKSVAKPN